MVIGASSNQIKIDFDFCHLIVSFILYAYLQKLLS